MHIAVLEDEQGQQDLIQSYVMRYGEETGTQFTLDAFQDGCSFIGNYARQYDIILLDIEMPGMTGMEIAEWIRTKDEDVVLMFITNMAQYAVNGYAVGALDFVLKPVNYNTFSMRFTRAIKRAGTRRSAQILLHLPDCVRRIETQQIYYVEVMNKMLHYHTELGEFVLRGTMQGAEKELSGYHFVRCNHWYLVNLQHVAELRRETVLVGDAELEISRRNRKSFLTALTAYVGGSR